jgi:hypothetical protein
MITSSEQQKMAIHDRYILFGCLPWVCLVKSVEEASLVSMGLFFGVLLALLLRKFPFEPTTKQALFMAFYPGSICFFLFRYSMQYQFEYQLFLFLLVNGMALVILESTAEELSVTSAIFGSAIVAVVLFLFALLSGGLIGYAGQEIKLLHLQPVVQPGILLVLLALLLVVINRFNGRSV